MLRAVAQMIQLAYQPAFDPFHTVYRLLRLRAALPSALKLPRDHIRILDFYLLFPFRVSDITLQRHHLRFKKLADKYNRYRPYGELPDDRVLFNRMLPIQSAAFDTLANKGFINVAEYELGNISTTEASPPNALALAIEKANAEQSDLLEFLTTLATDYSLLGEKGLKDRSKLMEYAYDAV
jgi:hypothetical protein